MSLPHNEQNLGKPQRTKKKRSVIFIVVVVSIAVHVIGLGGLAAVKIIEVLQPEPEFEAPPVVVTPPPPPPPPPPPTTKRAQRSLPRPQPLLAQNPQNMSVPAIEMNKSNLTIGGGRGFGGGLGALGGGVADSIRITSFGFDQALEGTLTGVLYDLKRNARGKATPGLDATDSKELAKQKVEFAGKVMLDFSRNFDINKLERNFSKSENKLYASYFVIPKQKASVAPKSFSAEDEIEPSLICAAYTGSYKPTESGRFRFVGRADDILVVRVNGKLVLDGSWYRDRYTNWRPSRDAEKVNEVEQTSNFSLRSPRITGDWFELKAGQKTTVDIAIGEVPGGDFGAYLLIEKEGEFKKRIFSTRPMTDQDKTFLRNTHGDASQFLD